jgi:soluble lytic murein transglycosylase
MSRLGYDYGDSLILMKSKFIYGIALSAILGLSWFFARAITDSRLLRLENAGKLVYGPLPTVEVDFYSYHSLERAFDSRLDLTRSENFSKEEFEKIILKSLPSQARDNFKSYVKETLALSVEYQMDPFWIISIMMVESGFDLKAQSNKNARGLMQIQPETAEHLQQIMGKKSAANKATEQFFNSENNIDVGIFYLKKLYQNFGLNYELATIAYNLGPNKLKNYIEERKDLRNFSYLVKVQESYKLLENNYLLELKAQHRNTSQNLANIPYRNDFFTDYSVQSKFFL